jgi:hypothetical protein
VVGNGKELRGDDFVAVLQISYVSPGEVLRSAN